MQKEQQDRGGTADDEKGYRQSRETDVFLVFSALSSARRGVHIISPSGCVAVVEAANVQFSADQGYFSNFGNAGFMWSHGCASDVHTSTCGFKQLGSSRLAVLIATI